MISFKLEWAIYNRVSLMFGINRSKRPVELGPFPAERLKRDATIIKSEAEAKHGVHSDTEISHLTPLISAINKHLSAYEELREALSL